MSLTSSTMLVTQVQKKLFPGLSVVSILQNSNPLSTSAASHPPKLVSQERLFPESERRKIRPEVARVWEEAEKNGFPSIAKLAYSTEWAPLQNLCRRRVISAEEAEEKYAGRTAVEWAEFYHESDLAAKLRYLLAPPTTEVAAKLETLGYKLAAQSSHP